MLSKRAELNRETREMGNAPRELVRWLDATDATVADVLAALDQAAAILSGSGDPTDRWRPHVPARTTHEKEQ